MTHTELLFKHARTPPDLGEFDVKHRAEGTVLGESATVAILGSSHYVGLPAIEYHELCSCQPIDSETTIPLPRRTAIDKTRSFEADELAVETTIEGRPLDAFPGPDTATVSYRFGSRAYTTVDLTDGGIETYHTYPEFDLALFSRTVFESLPRLNPHPVPTDD